MLLGIFKVMLLGVLKVLTPLEPPREQEKSRFDTPQVFDETGVDESKIDGLVQYKAKIATVVDTISPYCNGQIDWEGRIWTAMPYEDGVFETNDLVQVVGIYQLTCIVKKLPRSLCPVHSFN